MDEQSRELKARLKEQEAETARLRDLLAHISHDARGSLTTVIGNAELFLALWGSDVTDQQRHTVEAIRNAGHELSDLLDSLLEAELQSAPEDIERIALLRD